MCSSFSGGGVSPAGLGEQATATKVTIINSWRKTNNRCKRMPCVSELAHNRESALDLPCMLAALGQAIKGEVASPRL